MKQTIYFETFYQDLKSNYSLEGARALFDFLEGIEDSTGQSMDYDHVAIRCDFSEYENFAEIQGVYGNLDCMDDLRDLTTVIEIEDSEKLIISNF